MEKKTTKKTVSAKQLAALKKGREALKKKQKVAKKQVRKELSKTKKSIKKSTSKIMSNARLKASKNATKQVNALQKRLHKKGLAGEHQAYEIYLMLENNDGRWYNSLFDQLMKKAKNGKELSVDKLAESTTVKNQARKQAKVLKDAGWNVTLSDVKEGRQIFAAQMIKLVLESVENGY